MRSDGVWTILALSCLPCVVLFSVPSFAATKGPLTVHAGNGRYFADVSGTPVYLTGSHTWANFQERQYAVTADFDYDDYLDFLIAHNHNFMRMWSWEQAQWQQWNTDDNGPIVYSPMPFARTGPGAAIDGKPKFDLTKWNQAYFDRLRARVQAARDRGIYVSFMFFQGFSTGIKGTDSATGYSAWDGHPLNAANNINGIDGNPNGDGNGNEVHTYQVAAVTAVQEAFIRKVVNTLNDLDNVLWEIGNEMETPREFVDGMVEFLRAYEATKTTQHPIGISGYKNTTTGSFEWTGLIDGPADFVSPWNSGGDWMGSVTAVNGTKVFLLDTDHGDPWKTDPIWVWRALCRGHNPIVMDKYTDARFYPDGTTVPDPGYAKIRAAMGESRRVALMLNLAAATPQNGLASTGYCLADAGNSYVALQPGSGSFQVTLAAGAYTVEWIDVIDGSTSAGTHTQASDGAHSFTPPSHIGTHAAALVLLRSGSTYTLNVNNGSGGGNYTAGTVVNISANAAPSGQAFDKWVVDSGNPSIADATAANTTLTMPAAAVAVTATYKVVNNPPVANAQSVTTAENTAKAITLTGSDPDGDALTYITS